MKIIRKLLGVDRNWSDDEKLGMYMTLFNHESSFPAFLPVAVRLRDYEAHEPHRGTVQCANFFPCPKGSSSARNRQSIQCCNLIEMDPLHVLDDRLILPIDKFKFKKMPRISEFVKVNGAITFEIKDVKNAASLVKDLRQIVEGYKHTALLSKNTGGSVNRSSEKIITYLSIYDLPYAIPIYNTKKANGVGIHLLFLWDYTTENNRGIHNLGEVYLAANQYPENLLAVDGQKVFSEGFLGNDYMAHFNKALMKEYEREKVEEKGVAKAKKSGPKAGKGKAIDVGSISPRIKISTGSWISGSSTSTTTTYTS